MPVTIAPYSEKDIPAVREFNRRLRAAGAPEDSVFSETPISPWLPPSADAPLYNEFFLALDEGAVRGAYALKHQEFAFGGEKRRLVYYHHPYSEGVVNRKYTQVGLLMLMHVMRANPLLYALGMGSYDRPLPRMLLALQWQHCTIPFYFRVNHPARFLRNLRALRESGAKRALANAAAASGAGWLGLKLLHGVRGFSGMRARARVEEVSAFGDWTDEIWNDCAAGYAMIGVRDAASLRALYPASNRNFLRLRVSAGGRTIGWAAAADIPWHGHEQFGDLRVGAILDGLARPEHAGLVIAAATRALLDRGVDLLTSNQSHAAWQRALRRCGFLEGPSNFIFAVSKKLSAILHPFGETVPRSHINRGDGDSLMPYTYL